MYPVLLDLTGRRIVIVGGGAVGLRKATKLIEAGANDVTVVSPTFVEGFPPSVRKVTEAYQPAHLSGAVLVFAATDSAQINAKIVKEARQRNAWANRADEEGGDFTTPAVLRDGPVTIGVWADSPALSAAIRDGLRDRWDARWTAMAEAMQTLRPIILRSGLPPKQRREMLKELATQAAMEQLAAGGVEGLRDWIMSKYGGQRSQHD
jgi:precorrin-2 dehydrogenase / sirohydrochlorin ferrochelatase